MFYGINNKIGSENFLRNGTRESSSFTMIMLLLCSPCFVYADISARLHITIVPFSLYLPDLAPFPKFKLVLKKKSC
jgi:hypothetical protein